MGVARGVVFVTLHGVSDVGIYGLLAGKVAAYSVQQEHGLSYTLYLLTFALDSVGDVFGSFFMLGSGLLVLTTRVLPRWLGWSPLRPARFFVLASSVIGLTRASLAAAAT